jgi:hypothetical protein
MLRSVLMGEDSAKFEEILHKIPLKNGLKGGEHKPIGALMLCEIRAEISVNNEPKHSRHLGDWNEG